MMGCNQLTFSMGLGNNADTAFLGSTERNSDLETAVQWVHQLIIYGWAICVRWQQVKAQFISLVVQRECFRNYRAFRGQHSPLWFVTHALSLSKLDASAVHLYLGHRVLLHPVCTRCTTSRVKGLLKERNWLKMCCLAYLSCDVDVSCRVVKVSSADSRKLTLLLRGNCSQRFLSTEEN